MAAIFVWQFIVSTQFIPRNTCFIVFRLGDIRVGLHYIVNGILYTTLNLKPDFRYTQQETFSNQHNCSRSDITTTIALFLVKCLLFCASAQMGCTLQPVGITGGIACGKSTVSKILQEIIRKRSDSSSILFIDIDLIAHDILLPNPKRSVTAYWDIVNAFSDFDMLEDIR